MNYHLVLFGPPGAGKGTQAALLREKYNLKHISTGEIFRRHVKEQTDLGKKILGFMNAGLLVPDDLTIRIVLNEIKDVDGFILDGFPRTLEQAKALNLHNFIDAAIYIKGSEETLIRRLVGRRICSNKDCNEAYNIEYKIPKLEDICDVCSSSLFQRTDDNEETIKTRLSEYNSKTLPVLYYYAAKNKLYEFNGDKPIDSIFQDLCELINGFK